MEAHAHDRGCLPNIQQRPYAGRSSQDHHAGFREHFPLLNVAIRFRGVKERSKLTPTLQIAMENRAHCRSGVRRP